MSSQQRRNIFRWGVMTMPLAAVIALTVFLSGGQSADASAVVSGTVKDPLNVAVANVSINIWGPGGGGGSMTDGTGAYSVSLNPGQYSGQAVPPSGSAYAPSPVMQFDVIDGQPLTLNFTLTNVQMRGKFTRTDGTGVRGELDVFNSDFSLNIHINSNDTGDYVLGGLPAGTYTAQPRVGWEVTGLVPPDPSTIVLTTDSVLTKDFVLSPAAKTITGAVKKSSGTAVAGACVNANKMNGQGWANSNTDASGNYSLSLSGGSWNIQVNPCQPEADWIYSGLPIIIEFASDGSVESRTANFTVTAATVTISGTITDQNSLPVANGGLDFRTQEGAGAHANVNSNGTYSVRMTGGTYNVFFWSPMNAYNLPQTTVTVVDNETRTLNLVVQAKTAHIQGTVKDSGGAPATNVMVNANEMSNEPGKPGAWGNTRSDGSGNFDMLVTPGTYNINIGTEPNSSYVWANPSQIQVSVPTATSVITPATYSALNFIVAKADAKIVGRITAGGQPIGNAPLCVYARPAGVFNQPCNPLQPNGTFVINVSSASGTAYEMGCFSPPNMPYSCPQLVPVTIIPNGTVTKDLDLTINNSAIVGQLYDQSGFPLSNCSSFRGGRVFADNPGGNGAHYESEIGADCKYRISLVAGVFFLNSFFPPESGAMNTPPGAPVQVFSGQTVQKNIMVAKADATITVKLLDTNGVGTQGYINVDNNEEINASREGNKGPGGPPGSGKEGADLGFGKKMPCGATDIPGVIKCCKDPKNKVQCTDFKIPNGPNGCTNAYTCVQQCVKDPKICDQANRSNENAGPEPGQDFVGPGGCRSEDECRQYCSKPEHQDECSKFAPPPGVQSQSLTKTGPYGTKPTRIISSVQASAETGDDGGGQGPGFDKTIHSGGPTDFQGNAKIQVLSGHRYKVCAGLPPESNFMPPKCQTADLTDVKSASVTLQLREADAQLTGTVKLPDGTPVNRCFVHAWAEDGSFSGQPCSGNGTYRLNLTANTTWHYGADSMDGTKFYRSDEQLLVVNLGIKKYTQNLELKEGEFEIPQPVTVSGECSSPLVMTMSNQAKVSIPAGALSTATTGQCSCTATPTIDLISTKSNQPQGAGYTIDCRDETGAQVTQLKSSATITVPYTLSASEEGSSIEDALKPVLFQSDTQSYKTISSYTLDKENNLITFSVDHFSAYTVSNSSGVSSKNAALKTVTSSKSKAGITTFTVNKKKITPFPKCTGTVTGVTKSVNGTQLLAAIASCDTNLKVYDIKGRLKQTIKLGTRPNTVAFADVTKDGKADLVVAPASGNKVLVIQPGSKYRTVSVQLSTWGKLTANAVDIKDNGLAQLVTGVVRNNEATKLTLYNFQKGKFTASSSAYTAYLSGRGGEISLGIPKPAATKLSSKTFGKAATKAKFAITGSNLTPDTTIQVGGHGAKVNFKSVNQIDVTFNAKQLGVGTYTVKLTNPGGLATNAKTKVTVK